MSIKKIAELAHTSSATVSRVLNQPNYHCSKKGLKEEIWKYAMELNYLPNHAARNLKMGVKETENIYHLQILLTHSDKDLEDPFFEELLREVRSEIHRNQCILSKIWYGSAFADEGLKRIYEVDKFIKKMKSCQSDHPCDGLIIIGRCNQNALAQLKKEYRFILSLNRNATTSDTDEVLCDGRKAAALAMKHLFDLGHRKIAYIGECQADARYQGYVEQMQNHNLDMNINFIKDITPSEQAGYTVMEEFLAASLRPTAFYCANDITAVGMLKSLSNHRNRTYFPSVIASDNIEEGQFTTPMLTTVNLPKDQMSRFAVRLLLDRIKGGHKNIVRLELEGSLICRSSCTRVEETYITEYYI